MVFQITKAEIRAARMLQWFTGVCKTVTDLVVGSKMRTKFESIAVEMEEQDYQFSVALNKAIPIAIYQAFGFSIIPAQKASGEVTFQANPAPTENIFIPAGTQVATAASVTEAERVYSVVAGVTLLANTTEIGAQVVCTSPGPSGNTGIGTITVVKTNIPSITGCTNAGAFINGDYEETESARRARFKEYILSLTRGTAPAIEYGAKTAVLTDAEGNVTERVIQATVFDAPVAGEWGFFTCVIYNGSGSTSPELVARAQAIIDGYHSASGVKIPGYKAAGCVGTVVAATEVTLNITAAIEAKPGYDTADIATAVEERLRAYVASLRVGQEAVYSAIIGIIMDVTGVYSCAVTVPAADVAAANDVKLVAGTITLTVT